MKRRIFAFLLAAALMLASAACSGGTRPASRGVTGDFLKNMTSL